MPDASPDSIEQLLERFHADAFQWARVCCQGGPEAADVLQSAYARILGGRAKFGGRSSFKTWLLGVVRCVAHEERKKHRRAEDRFALMEEIEANLGEQPGPDEALIQRERENQVLALLEILPARQRQVLHLVFYQELTIQQSAEALGISLGAARQHYERGKAALRSQLFKEKSL